MSELTINTIHFAAYEFDLGEKVEWEDSGSSVYGEVRDRTKESFTVDGTEITGSGSENVYKVEEYDTESGEFSEQIDARPENRLSAWSGPQNASDVEDEPETEDETSPALDDANISFAASAISPQRKEIITDFNEHGIRENYDNENNLVSVDAVFEAMESGPPEDRNGVRITKEFLQNVAEKDYSNDPPYLMDHTKDTLSQIGFVKDVWYNESTDKLMLMARAYNTGSQTHDEIIKRLTFDPPTLTDGSVGFGNNYEATKNDDGETVLVDGKMREFSSTPFPAGYDDGGLKTDYDDDTSEVGVFVVAS